VNFSFGFFFSFFFPAQALLAPTEKATQEGTVHQPGKPDPWMPA
jgi:hypothetical protein